MQDKHKKNVNLLSGPVDPIKIGKVTGVYGVLGWVKIISFTSNVSDIFNCYNLWFILIQHTWNKIYFDRWRFQKKNFIAKIIDTSDRESARRLVGFGIFVGFSQFLNLEKDEYYWKDLIGCQVNTIKGCHLGYVTHIIDTTANEVLVIHPCNRIIFFYKIKDILIPFIYKKVIKDVDILAHVITVDWNFIC